MREIAYVTVALFAVLAVVLGAIPVLEAVAEEFHAIGAAVRVIS
jgi:hypothetical protein